MSNEIEDAQPEFFKEIRLRLARLSAGLDRELPDEMDLLCDWWSDNYRHRQPIESPAATEPLTEKGR